jgi:uncharacterized protein YciI
MMMGRSTMVLLGAVGLVLLTAPTTPTHAFSGVRSVTWGVGSSQSQSQQQPQQQQPWALGMSSFVSESSDYTAGGGGGDGGDDEDLLDKSAPRRLVSTAQDAPTMEHEVVGMSRNNVGSRWVALVWDKSLEAIHASEKAPRGPWELHFDRISRTEEHILFCRKQNLYNETFNLESRADIVWSYPMLASDVKRTIGHAMCIDSPTLEDAKEALGRDPYVMSLTGGDTTHIPLFRWRHIRDHMLRQDDGRNGWPYLLVAMDDTSEEHGALRQQTNLTHLEYMIRSERVIAAGPLHPPTADKNDAEGQTAVGTLMLFNAQEREEAISFCEDDPAAQAGLYGSMRVHRYNNLDVTGKFVSPNIKEIDERRSGNTDHQQMRDALDEWGYPVHDEQTPWLNW